MADVDGGWGAQLHNSRKGATFQPVVGRIDRAWTSVTNEAILSGFRKARLLVIGTDADGESEDRLTEEGTVLHLPLELVELLFRSDTEDEELIGYSDAELRTFGCGLLEYVKTFK